MYDTIFTFLQLEADVLAKLRQPALNYTRYSKDQVDRALNATQVEMVKQLRCLHSFAIIILKNGYPQYAAPSDMIAPKNAFFYQNPQSYYEIKIKSRDWLDKYSAGWRQVKGSQPTYMYVGDSNGYNRYLGFTPTPNTDGSNYLILPDTGVVISGTGLTTTGNITGQNTTANATTCTDSGGAQFAALGVQLGMMALNNSDGSKGQISAVNGATFTATLAGGTNNTWAVNDTYTILAGEYGVVTGVNTADEQYVFSQDLGKIVSISALTHNVYMEYYRRPLLLQFPNQYPEVPFDMQEYLADGACFRLKRTAPKGSDDLSQAIAFKQVFDKAIHDYTSLDGEMDSSGMDQNW